MSLPSSPHHHSVSVCVCVWGGGGVVTAREGGGRAAALHASLRLVEIPPRRATLSLAHAAAWCHYLPAADNQPFYSRPATAAAATPIFRPPRAAPMSLRPGIAPGIVSPPPPTLQHPTAFHHMPGL